MPWCAYCVCVRTNKNIKKYSGIMWHQIDLNSENTREVRWRLLGFEVKLLPNKDFNYSRLDIIIDISVCKPDVKGLRDMNLAKSLYRCHD